MANLNQIDREKMRLALEQRRASLIADGQSAEQARETVMLDQQSVGRLSRMDALQVQAMAQAQQRNRANELVRIDQALSRLNQGEFGTCVDCGEDIAPKRLAADPAVLLCLPCAQARD